MTETSLDRIIPEERFASLLSTEAELFFRLANTLRKQDAGIERRLHTYQLGIEADLVEAFLDDHGAKNNQGFSFFRELVASIRGFSRVGFHLAHLNSRLSSYQTLLVDDEARNQECRTSLALARAFVRRSMLKLFAACKEEARKMGVVWSLEDYPADRVSAGPVNLRLPHNVGEEVIDEEDRRVAEVASKYLQVCGVLRQAGIRRFADHQEREAFLEKSFTEERARVYEATVHNLQSTYDTYIKGTTLERQDDRLSCLRGHASGAFHFLEAVTDLVHFIERHDAGDRQGSQRARMGEVISRASAIEVVVNDLLYWSQELLLLGEGLAREILSSYSQLKEIELAIPEGVAIHARPASLIVAVVNHHEMPVELEICGKICNAASILEVLICAGSNPDAEVYTFRGDARPLADLQDLFAASLGEEGFERFPESLEYLAPRS
ncbi:MAG: phosphotransferase system HPr-like phosphotransfer protein [Gammaproteobacteria bacterium]|jgi:phosphotransferase system HPr-like phosphotransfer protein